MQRCFESHMFQPQGDILLKIKMKIFMIILSSIQLPSPIKHVQIVEIIKTSYLKRVQKRIIFKKLLFHKSIVFILWGQKHGHCLQIYQIVSTSNGKKNSDFLAKKICIGPTSTLFKGIVASFCNASFNSALLFMGGSLCPPLAATMIVIYTVNENMT